MLPQKKQKRRLPRRMLPHPPRNGEEEMLKQGLAENSQGKDCRMTLLNPISYIPNPIYGMLKQELA